MGSKEEILGKVVECDVLVLGGGIAGCMGAIQAKTVNADADVVLVDRGFVGKTGQSAFMGGDLMVFHPEWGHEHDFWMDCIIQPGEYLNDRKWIEVLLEDSYAVFSALASYGVNFVKDKNGEPYRKSFGSIESVHTYSRRLMPQMRKKVKGSGVKIYDHVAITDLLKQDGRVVGAVGFHRISGDFYIFKAGATIAATGSACFKACTFTQMSPGTGQAMGYRVGAELISMEGGGKRGPRPAKCDTVRFKPASSTGKYFNQKGESIIERYSTDFGGLVYSHKLCAAAFEIEKGHGPVYLDFGTLSDEEKKQVADGYYWEVAETTLEQVERSGLKPEGKVEHVVQYQGPPNSGGLRVNTKCETTVPGLYAVGDTAGTNASGMGYAACGLQFLQAALTGYRAGQFATEYARKSGKPVVDENEVARLKEITYSALHREGGFRPQWLLSRIQWLLEPYDVLLFKHDRSMQASLMMVEEFRDYFVPKLWAEDYHQLANAHDIRNMVQCAEMILRASLFRTESRGEHLRASYLFRDDKNWLAWVVCKEEDGKLKLRKEPIPKEYWPDLSKSVEERYSFKYSV